jgi:hypothetical protein
MLVRDTAELKGGGADRSSYGLTSVRVIEVPSLSWRRSRGNVSHSASFHLGLRELCALRFVHAKPTLEDMDTTRAYATSLIAS